MDTSALAGAPGAAFRRRLLRTIVVRAVAASALLGSAIVFRVGAGPSQIGIDTHFFLIAITYGLTGAYAASMRYVDRHPWIVDLQFAADTVVISVAVAASGGIFSSFGSLYALPIAAAAVLRWRRGSLLVAALATTEYAAVIAAQYGGVWPDSPEVWLPSAAEAFYRVTLHGCAFLAIGTLTGLLAEERRRADYLLASASSRIADLQAFNQSVIDSLPGGVLTTTDEGQVLSVNRAASSIAGRAPAEMLGRSVVDVLELPGGDLRLHLGPEPVRMDYEYMKPAGQRIVLGLGIAPLTTDSLLRGHVFTFQDVTESKRRDAESQLQKRLAAIGEMAAGIAHEIRNPLASMSGSMQILRRELPLTHEQARLMDIVLRESERLNDTIRNFLLYAKPAKRSSGRVSLDRVVRETAALLGNSPERRDGHSIRVESADGEAACDGDEGQLRQVVWNLATNGLRAMPQGGTLTLRLTRGMDASGREITGFVVEDTGVGLGPEQQEVLFQPFHSQFAQGTGLGLAIAQRIVVDHGGCITVSSAPGKGAALRVLLPASAARPDHLPIAV